jgi:hypothetical protein
VAVVSILIDRKTGATISESEKITNEEQLQNDYFDTLARLMWNRMKNNVELMKVTK